MAIWTCEFEVLSGAREPMHDLFSGLACAVDYLRITVTPARPGVDTVKVSGCLADPVNQMAKLSDLFGASELYRRGAILQSVPVG